MANWEIGQRVDLAPSSEPIAHARSPQTARRWALVNVEQFREDKTEERIGDLGYLVYLPRFSKRERDRRRHRVWRDVIKPLFPGYLFVKLAPDIDPWGDMERVRGVVSVVRAGDKPGRVPDLVMDELQAAESGNFSKVRDGGFKPGERLRVTYGPFADHIVRFVTTVGELDAEGRIMALLDLFGQAAKLELRADQVERD